MYRDGTDNKPRQCEIAIEGNARDRVPKNLPETLREQYFNKH